MDTPRRMRTRDHKEGGVVLSIGAMAPPFAQQLADAGYPVPENIEHHQKDADALIRLSVRGLIAESQKRGVSRKLVKALAKDVSAALNGESHEQD